MTSDNYWGTVIQVSRTAMANIIPTDKQIAVIGVLAEGCSIRSIERITGVHRDTIMRLGVIVGVFDLIGDSKASTIYAWTSETGDPGNPKHHVTVLHLGPVKLAIDAVRPAIVQEFRGLESQDTKETE